jgi:tRNA-splicing ligase RtcB
MFVYKKEGMKVPIKSWVPEVQYFADTKMVVQCENAAKLPFAVKQVVLSADGHSGYGVPIGTVFASDFIIVPYIVGVDISCGVIAMQTNASSEIVEPTFLKEILGKIRTKIPFGLGKHNAEKQEWLGFDSAPDIPVIQQELNSARYQLSSGGSGNHFWEIQKGSDGFLWIMIHSGSRNIGYTVANHYQKVAKDLCAKWMVQLPDPDLAFLPLDTQQGSEYFLAMHYCGKFAQENRSRMLLKTKEVLAEYGITEQDHINIHHNYAAIETHFGKEVLVHRKGATSASIGQRGIIPGSMGTCSYIVKGKGNPDSFYSCSHGAGRRLGRKEAIRTLNLDDELKKMEGVVHGVRTTQELEECPGAYKDIDEVMANQTDLVDIVTKLTPLAVIKG